MNILSIIPKYPTKCTFVTLHLLKRVYRSFSGVRRRFAWIGWYSIRKAPRISRFFAGKNLRPRERMIPSFYFIASIPPIISLISLVIALWRALLYSRVRENVTSLALSEALRIATIRAECSDAFSSRNAW